MTEIWKDIKDFEGLYQISNFGRVKSLKTGKILKQTIKENGYLQIGLYKNNKKYYFLVHRLVTEAFIDNPNNYPQVNHISGIKSENNVDNLEWCNASQNGKHAYDNNLSKPQSGINHGNNRLTEKQVLEIRALEGIKSYPEISTEFGICKQHVCDIINRKKWKHI